MERIENEVFYGISINGKKPNEWGNEYPNIPDSLNLEVLQYKRVEIIKKDVTYQSVEKVK